MRRAVASALALAGAGAAVLAWLIAPADPLPARFGAADCGRVGLTDARTGWRISGAEDLVLAPDGATLIVSAHDRMDPAMPDGGLYAVDLADLAPGATVPAPRLDAPRPEGARFRPHGIALHPGGDRLAVINRLAEDEAVVEIGPLGPGGWAPDRLIEDPRLCRANDLAFAGQGEALEITLDRTDCTTSFRDLMGGTGSVLRAEGNRLEVALSGLAFPNGILDGHVAETRANRLRRPDRTSVALPGGPDNLTPAPGGGMVAAAHPDLLAVWGYLRGWSGRAPARILLIDPAFGEVEVLYDEPEGALFSAATAAVLADGRLVAGSVRDAGLLVCGPAR